jgi:hypothetical protein
MQHANTGRVQWERRGIELTALTYFIISFLAGSVIFIHFNVG